MIIIGQTLDESMTLFCNWKSYGEKVDMIINLK